MKKISKNNKVKLYKTETSPETIEDELNEENIKSSDDKNWIPEEYPNGFEDLHSG